MVPVHLLLVEDSALVAQALRVLFEGHGYQVSVAESVADAVACAAISGGAARKRLGTPATSGESMSREARAAGAVDIMLLDLTLPDGDGLSVLARLQDLDCAPPPVTIALTGHDDDAIRDRCLAAGCERVLVKPIPTQELLAVVQASAANLY